MKHLKCIGVCLLVVAMFALLVLPASADIIVEPDNLFYRLHMDECEHTGIRYYIANSEAGHVYAYQSPVSNSVVAAYSNGEKLSIRYIYTDTDGERWGLRSQEDAWVCMSDVSVVYDSQSFLEEHGEECVNYDDYENNTYDIMGTEETPVVLWNYPGGEITSYRIETKDDISEYIGQLYTDADGVVWGYIGYIYGRRNVWVCVSSPYSTTVGGYDVERLTPVLKAEPTPNEEIPMPFNATPFIVAGVLVVAVVAVTGIIIAVVYAKKHKKTEET